MRGWTDQESRQFYPNGMTRQTRRMHPPYERGVITAGDIHAQRVKAASGDMVGIVLLGRIDDPHMLQGMRN